MWFDTLVLQLRLHMAYRVNGILYRLRFLSLSYESGFAKTLGLVLAILRELLGLLLGKLLYMAAFFAAPLLLFPSEPPAGLYGHLLLFLTLIGGIFNSKLLDAEQDVYYAVFLLRMDARRYALSAYGYTLLKDFMGFLTAALVVGRLALQAPLALCLLTPVLVCSVKLTAAGLELAHFTRRRRLAREAKWFPVLQGLGLLLLAGRRICRPCCWAGPSQAGRRMPPVGFSPSAARGAPVFWCASPPSVSYTTASSHRITWPC